MLDFSVLDHYRQFALPVWVHDTHRHRHACVVADRHVQPGHADLVGTVGHRA
jgi:hypothetical protein